MPMVKIVIRHPSRLGANSSGGLCAAEHRATALRQLRGAMRPGHRERVFYPALAIAVSFYYLAFAVADGRNEVMLSEVAIAAVFIVAAVAGFKRSTWFAVVALGGHGVMDAFHHHIVHNAGVPQVWPAFCMTFDVTAPVGMAVVVVARARGERLQQRTRAG